MLSKNIIRVVIIEDDEIIRKSYTSIINDSEKYICTADYDNFEEAIKNISKDEPKIILIDSVLPEITGVEGIRRIKSAYSKADILVLTFLEDDKEIFDALCAGACGYLTKNTKPENFIRALDVIVRGEASMNTNIAKLVLDSVKRTKKNPLTSKEIEVLHQIADGKSYSMIAEKLLTNKETVRSQIKNIYKKLPLFTKT
ncbi:MAG: response regulator transcription factor [Ignavibacteriaceae bacterium]|jgi:DNA-binding NarL/FixJ family response regulator|nr:response regulator transcription factor [Ignavibacteriaceae bacterium]MCW8812606.1 response regulator transcription factor [Chlorobium sp.]MCW8818371.1 response regulator transcription factor [Ignavibacteriaceae bacterium]MCW8997028.1 response regulator transcription factor [Psychromonas sp.]